MLGFLMSLAESYGRAIDHLYRSFRARPVRLVAAFGILVLSIFTIEKIIAPYIPGGLLVLIASVIIAPFLFGVVIRFLRDEYL